MSKELNIPLGDYELDITDVSNSVLTPKGEHIFISDLDLCKLFVDTANTYQRTKKLPSEMEEENKELNIPGGEYIADTFSVFQNTKTGDRLHLIFCADASTNELIADTLNTYQRTKKLPSEMEEEHRELLSKTIDLYNNIIREDKETIKELEQEVERYKDVKTRQQLRSKLSHLKATIPKKKDKSELTKNQLSILRHHEGVIEGIKWALSYINT